MRQALPRIFLKPHISFHFLLDTLQIKMETERLFICSYRDSDFEDCVSLYSNKEITKYFDYGKARTRHEVTSLIREKGSKYFSRGKPFGLFSIFRKNDMAFIGQIDLLPSDKEGVLEIGFILHKQYQNQGFCTEAVKALIFDYIEELNYRGFTCKELPINKVIATVHPENKSSIRILQKVGMVLDKIQERFNNPRLWYSISTPLRIKNQKTGSR
ncbi:MAG: GNAT family N-acetyltransferase [Rhabdochlamydiaceae bacterium]